MSDHPSDLELKLQHAVVSVKDVTEWYDLGLQLGLPDSTLASIASHPDVKGHKRTMLSEWLQYDPEASWEKLASALTTIGKKVIAANIRRQFLGGVVEVSSWDHRIRKSYTFSANTLKLLAAAREPIRQQLRNMSLSKV